MNIDIRILDHLLTMIQIDEVVARKTLAVRNQQFAEASKILDEQRQLEKNLLTYDELKQLREELIKLQNNK